MRNNSTTEMNFRCVEVRVCKQEDFLAKPEQEEGVGGWGGVPTQQNRLPSPNCLFPSTKGSPTSLPPPPSPTK